MNIHSPSITTQDLYPNLFPKEQRNMWLKRMASKIEPPLLTHARDRAVYNAFSNIREVNRKSIRNFGSSLSLSRPPPGNKWQSMSTFSFSATLDCSTCSELIEDSDRAINIAPEGEYLRLLLKFAWRSNGKTDADEITQIGMGHIATITKMGVYISMTAKGTQNTFLQNRR